MAENLFASFDYAGQGMSVQRMRLGATAENIANANTTSGPNGETYKRRVVIVRELAESPFSRTLDDQISLGRTSKAHAGNANPATGLPDNSILEAQSAEDNSPARLVYDPGHPDANEEGYVAYPNVNIVTEMVEMISAQRAFQANAGMMEAAKNIARDSLEI